jgi:hypothetical protein
MNYLTKGETMHLHIATPMYGGNCKGIYLEGLMALTFELAKKGYQISFSKIYNESLITRARNNLVYEFEKSGADALLFIDADEGFNHLDVIQMIESDKDVIGAVYPMKNINWESVRKAALAGKENLADYSGFFALNLLPEEITFKITDPVPVTEVGTGMLFIKKEVFELMKPHCGQYMLNTSTGAFDKAQMVTEYFTTDITEDGILLSEDYYFCRKYRELGGTVYAAPWVKIVHAGEYIFNGNFANQVIFENIPEEKPKTKKK